MPLQTNSGLRTLAEAILASAALGCADAHTWAGLRLHACMPACPPARKHA
eukprot:CAMPEP_0175694902 /NCGR_PEP_ID=MMETSP0097-20121207/32168_1 /TAXON_ID=311494 /ORGANISM="Alexandrium monilatum, Strain CCMP3105" /LENGTH=49 /DNA_ID= /DNA_START= /DNA_END= /DNA_ORIENTATION=